MKTSTTTTPPPTNEDDLMAKYDEEERLSRRRFVTICTVMIFITAVAALAASVLSHINSNKDKNQSWTSNSEGLNRTRPTASPMAAASRPPSRNNTLRPSQRPVVRPSSAAPVRTKSPNRPTAAPQTVPLQPSASPTRSPSWYLNANLTCLGVPGLCDLPVNRVMMGGVHNAMASAADGFAIINQDKNLENALAAGYRSLFLDIGTCSDGSLQLIHDSCFFGRRNPVQVFTNILQFLQNNPTEVVMVVLQIDGADITLDDINTNVILQVAGLQDALYKDNVTSTGDWPTIRQLIQADTRFLLFHHNGPTCDSGCPPGFHYWFDWAAETEFQLDSIREVQNTTYACPLTRGYTNGRRNFFCLNVFLQLPSRTASSETLNTASFLTRHVLNCTNYLRNTTQIRDLRFNVIIVDFWDSGDVLTVVTAANLQQVARYQLLN